MTTKVRASKKQRHKARLTEQTTLSTAKVDREAGVIRGVKVLGLTSRNGRRYLPEAIREAVSLYEGASVRRNHPKKANDQRDVDDVFGWLEAVEARDDGLYADLRILNPRTPLAESVMNAAESAPHLFGLSHNADGETEQRGRETIVHRITEVRSVDLVADPATTGGLFESISGQKTMKLKALFESVLLFRPQRRVIEKLFEDDMMDPGMDVPLEAPAEGGGGDPHELLRQGFRAACGAVLDDDSLDTPAKLKKLKEILAAADKLLAGGEEVKEEDADKGDDDEEVKEGCDDDEEKDMKESRKLKAANALLEAKLAVRELCDERKITPSAALMEALLRLPDDKARNALLDEVGPGASKAPANKTRTQTPLREGHNPGGHGNTQIKSGEDFARQLRERAFNGTR